MFRIVISIAAFFGVGGLALDAIGAHALPTLLHDNPAHASLLSSWQSAVRIQLVHAVVLLAIAALQDKLKPILHKLSLVAIIVGVLLFSGSIYLRILLENPSLSRAAPTGGILLMTGWLLLALGVPSKRLRSP